MHATGEQDAVVATATFRFFMGTVRRALLFKLADMQDNKTQSDSTFTLNNLLSRTRAHLAASALFDVSRR